MPYGESELSLQWFRHWLIDCSMQNHTVNKCWINNWTLRKKFSKNQIKILRFSLTKKNSRMSIIECKPICSCMNVLTMLEFIISIHGETKINKNTLETCKNPRPTSGWSELTDSCTTSTMNFHMAYFSWIPRNNAKFKLSCKFGESKCNPC